MASGGQCRCSRRLAEVSLVGCSPAERLMRTPQIIPVEELGKAALLFDAVGRWAQVDPFMLHGPPQALDEDVVVAAPASIHADFDPVIPQHVGELLAGELRALIGIEDAGLAEPGEGLVQRFDAGWWEENRALPRRDSDRRIEANEWRQYIGEATMFGPLWGAFSRWGHDRGSNEGISEVSPRVSGGGAAPRIH